MSGNAAGSVPDEAAEASPSLFPAFARPRGHVGFAEGPPWAPRFWAEEGVARFLARRLKPETR